MFLVGLLSVILFPRFLNAAERELSSKGICFNIALIVLKPDGGSGIMRGFMVEEGLNGLNSDPLCVQAKTFSPPLDKNIFTNFLTYANHSAACVFVKTILRDFESICGQVNAPIFHDVVDNPGTARDMAKHIVTYHSPTFHKPYRGYLVQSTFLATSLMKIHVAAYYYPHHHSNTFLPSSVKKVTDHETLVVGMLAGNEQNIPNLNTCILPGVCAVGNVELHVIDQHVGDIDVNTHVSQITSSKKIYDCNREKTTGKYNYHTSVSFTNVSESNDKFVQAAFYLDKSLLAIDVGLVWTNKNIHPSNVLDFEMLRPPTRMLHWMSRGVPVVYFPTHSYADVAKQNDYEKDLESNLSAYDIRTVRAAVEKLKDVEVRETLSKKVLQIASQYTAEKIALRLLKAITEQSMACYCKSNSYTCFIKAAYDQDQCSSLSATIERINSRLTM